MNSLPFIDLGGTWHITYFIGIALIIPFYVFYESNKLPLSLKLLLVWLLLWCVYLIEYPRAHFGERTPFFQLTASQVFIETVFIAFAAIRFKDLLGLIAPYLASFATLCVWFTWPGFMHAPSFNMALAAMCLPVIRNKWFRYFIIFTALTHHGSTALLIILAQILGGVIKKKIKWAGFGLSAGVMLTSAYFLQNQIHFNSGERIQHWIEYMTFWSQDIKRVILGAGPGSFVWYSIMTHKFQTGLYLQMHNDYLEILWALGLVGGGLAVWTLVDTVKKAWKAPTWMLQGLLGCLAFMLTYEPLEYFPTALLTAFYFANVFLVVEDVDVELTNFAWPIK